MSHVTQMFDAISKKMPWNRVPDTPRIIHINNNNNDNNNNANNNEPDNSRRRNSQNNYFPLNDVSTTKYNVITFIPKNLLIQFSRFANILFLLIACLQLFSGLSPTGRYDQTIDCLLDFHLLLLLLQLLSFDSKCQKTDKLAGDS